MTVVVNSQQGQVGAGAATTLAITPTGIVAGRSLVLFFGSASGATGSMTAVSDTGGGNTWVLPDPPKGGITGVTNTFLATAYVHNCVAPGTITVTSNSVANRKILLLEITGLQNATADDAQEDFTQAAALTAVTPATTMTQADFVIGAVIRNDVVDPSSVTAGWTQSNTGVPDNTVPILRAAWREFTTAGSSGTCTFTYTGSNFQPGCGAIAFKVTAAPLVPKLVVVRRVGSWA